VPFLKIDKGLQDRQWDVQLMRDIPGLDQLLERAREGGVFGTKARSVIHAAEPDGVARAVQQQVELGERVLDAGLVPILEPEVSIDAPDKAHGVCQGGREGDHPDG
jgi:fructose-bisphosphate aldolase, class I